MWKDVVREGFFVTSRIEKWAGDVTNGGGEAVEREVGGGLFFFYPQCRAF